MERTNHSSYIFHLNTEMTLYLRFKVMWWVPTFILTQWWGIEVITLVRFAVYICTLGIMGKASYYRKTVIHLRIAVIYCKLLQGTEKFSDFLFNAAYLIFHVFDTSTLLVMWLTYLWNFYSDEILDIFILVVDIMFLFTMLTFNIYYIITSS